MSMWEYSISVLADGHVYIDRRGIHTTGNYVCVYEFGFETVENLYCSYRMYRV